MKTKYWLDAPSFTSIHKKTDFRRGDTMQYSYTQLLVVIFCAMLIVDHVDGIRVRIPSLRISSSFSKTADANKKKATGHKTDIQHPAKTIPLKIPSGGPKDGF